MRRGNRRDQHGTISTSPRFRTETPRKKLPPYFYEGVSL
jgi:hypothetical protein